MSSTIPNRPEVQEEDLVIKERRERHLRLVARLQEWMNEDGDYDERVGTILNAELEREGIRREEENDSTP